MRIINLIENFKSHINTEAWPGSYVDLGQISFLRGEEVEYLNQGQIPFLWGVDIFSSMTELPLKFANTFSTPSPWKDSDPVA